MSASRAAGKLVLPSMRGLTPAARRAALTNAGLRLPTDALLDGGSLDTATANQLAENVIGTFALPLGVATGLVVNGREVPVPMVTEEPSVIAAVCHMGKLTRKAGGFAARCVAV
jgi:hydroxymethylglutaryl-CoA reductase